MSLAPAPDIIWILTTQWRAQAAGWAGDPNARTPHLDALARSSWNFAQAVTPHPFGPFARAALLTGIPSPANGIANYFDPLPRGTNTIAHRLRTLGYRCAWFGKWHLSQRDPSAPLVGETHARAIVAPEDRGGFDFWEGFESGFLLNGPWLHGTRLPEPTRFTGYQADILLERAAAWLDSETKGRATPQPRFTVVSLEAPHPPYGAPAAGIHSMDTSSIALAPNVPRGGAAEETARRELAGYYAHIEATDRAIGRFLSSPAAKKAWLVFTSVHGDMHGAHGLFRKGWPHEESVRVPLLVRAPESGQSSEPQARPAPRGTRLDDCVSLLDLGAMTLDLAAAARRGDATAAPRFSQEAGFAHLSMPSVVSLPHQCDRVWRGLRTATRKLILNADGSPWLCFDLSADPFELRNLASEAGFHLPPEFCGITERQRGA